MTKPTAERKKLIRIVITRYISGFIITSAVIFLPAWTLNFWNGWLLLGLFFIPMLLVMIYLITRDPELLEKRMKMKEKEEKQKAIQIIGGVFLVLSFIIPGLDYRFHWSEVPAWLVAVSAVIVEIGYILFFIVMKQNSYASRVIEIQEGQRIIDTGLYSVVRHPMYLSIILIYTFAPMVLGSYIALIPALVQPFILAYRIINEEKVLINGLAGYRNYMAKVKYRMIPIIW